jgi:calcineurin-like phosphoesterase family protein
MNNYLFLGDTHGDLDFATAAADLARQHTAEIIQCGDWGFIWPSNTQIDELSAMLVERGVTLRFVDGNHDDHATLQRLSAWGHIVQGQQVPAVTIANNVLYQPRGSVHEDKEGTRFLFLGGAPSIDQEGRVEGKSWWPEETIKPSELHRALAAKAPINVLVTHDAPDYPPDFSAKGSPWYRVAQITSMHNIDTCIYKHRPQLHVHGHWHTRYTRQHRTGTRIEGLNCNELDSAYLAKSTLLWSRQD